MFADDQLRPAIGLMREMGRWAKRKSSNPVGAADDCVRFQMKQVDILANRRATDAAVFLHDQSIRQNPGEANSCARMNLITELFFQKWSTQLPWQKKTEEH